MFKIYGIGIISNQTTGKDNREEIKSIVRDSMKRSNSKVFLDDTFGGREKWTKDSIVIMNKYDIQLENSRSGSKQTISSLNTTEMAHILCEDIDAETLFDKKKDLFTEATEYEEGKFMDWKAMLASYREIDPNDPKLDPKVDSCIGFPRAQRRMRDVMLVGTAARLPPPRGGVFSVQRSFKVRQRARSS
ncbi:hypothetical protein ACHAWF_016078 [Thalassiosira exigua]